MQKIFKVPKLGRMQIGLSSGHDPSVVAAAMKLTPIKVEIVKYSADGFELMMTFPQGIKASILENSEEYRPYYANIKNEAYSMLFVPRKRGQGVVFKTDSNKLTEELLLTRKLPLIVEPIIKDLREDTKFQLLVGCYKSIEIKRSEACEHMIAHDPFCIPDEMVSTLSIIDEDIPMEINQARVLSNRVNNVRELFKWYAKKLLADNVHEELRVIQCKLDDFQIRVDSTWENVDSTPDVTVSSEDVVSQFNTYDGFEDLTHAVYAKTFKSIPIHRCGNCDGKPKTEKRVVAGDNGSKEIYFVECTNCGSRQKRSDWGLRYQAIASWNKTNGRYSPRTYPVGYQLDNLREDELFKKLKSLNLLINKIEDAARAGSVTTRESMGITMERLAELKVWNAYIRTALKESRKVKWGLDINHKTD